MKKASELGKKTEEDLQESNNLLQSVIGETTDTIFVKDLSGRYLMMNSAGANIIGKSIEEIIGKDDTQLFSHNVARKLMEEDQEIIASGKEIVFDEEVPKSGKIHIFHTVKVPYRNYRGNIIGVIGIARDITERKQLEKGLKALNESLEQHVAERTAELLKINEKLQTDITERKKIEEQLKTSLKEKKVLLKEVYHRVKNNMQIMASLLSLQSEGIKDKHLLDLFNESRNRIKSMALIHEDLYSGKNLARIDFDQYTRTLTARLAKSYGVDPNRIVTSVNIDNVFLGADKAVPCGLIINELFTNSLKHAFPNLITDAEHRLEKDVNREQSTNKGEICINFHSDNDEHTLIFSDNGVGLSKDFDFQNTKTLGLELVRTLVKQIDGTIEYDGSGGTEVKITFKAESQNPYKNH